MIRLVNSLADLTSLRDRDELEIVMAQAASELVGASMVKLWRVVGDADVLRLHERALLVDRIATIADLPSDLDDLVRLDSRRELSACYRDRTPIPVSRGADGRRRHIFPIMSAKGIDGLLDVYVAAPLRDSQRRLVSGLLRIYQNHLKVLDYSEKDELTGLLNRKTFDTTFALLTEIEAPRLPATQQFERIDRRRPVDALQPRWLAVLDVDFFKRVNDRFGHPCGDDVLASVAQLMRNSFRGSDQLFRCGGEEFVVILEPTDEQYVRGILERFRTVVEDYDFPEVGSVTVSIGYTRVAAGDKGAVAFRRADEALYAAKRRGRNCVISYEEMASDGIVSPEAPAVSDARIH
jgi:diguanylate cyclase (GGDEF)-like protein